MSMSPPTSSSTPSHSRQAALALPTATAFLCAASLLIASFFLLGAHGAEHPKPGFNDAGELLQPQGWREWVYVGTPLTPNDLNPPEAAFPEFHNVYIHPSDFAHYKRTGEFPDGTILVKELVSVGSKQAVSGNGYFMGDFVGLEATVKSTKHFPDEPGNWAYFSFGHSLPLAETAAAFPTKSCNACHEASATQDFIFTQYYPVLRAAHKGKAQAASGAAMREGNATFDGIASAMESAMDNALEASAPTRAVDGMVPTDSAKLFEFLREGKYLDFEARESRMHPSRGPHTKYGLPVRVFLDPKLATSLDSGSASHPAGAAAVKEMFDGATGKLQGWAVAVKTHDDSAGGRGWYWYEVTSTTDGSDPVAAGNGVPLCFGCHSTGEDFILTDHPLR